MKLVYGGKSETLQPCEIDQESMKAIGRLIRAVAEIEYIISLYIGARCRLSTSQLVVLLGRTAISKKLEIAAYLAKMAGEERADRFEMVFDSNFALLLKIRNAVAHGVLMGLDSEGAYNFLTTDTDAPDDGVALQLVLAFDPTSLANAAINAERFVDYALDQLALRASRDISIQQPLRPHRKAARGKDGKHVSQRQASQAKARQAKLDKKAEQRRDPKNRKKEE